MMDLEGLKASARDAKRAADAVLDGMGQLQVAADALSCQGMPCRFEVGDGEVRLIADFADLMKRAGMGKRQAIGGPVSVSAQPVGERGPEAVMPPAKKTAPAEVPAETTPAPTVDASQFAPAWDDESTRRLSDFWRQGLSIPEIAKKMGRGEKQVKNKTYNMRKKGKLPERTEPVPPAAKVEPVAKPVIVEPAPSKVSASSDSKVAEDPAFILRGSIPADHVNQPVLVGDALALLKLNPVKVGAWVQYLNTLPEDDFWTPRHDLRLITNICAGRAKGTTAVDLGRDWADCVARFKVLHPFTPTPTSQGALIKALRERAAA